MAFVREMISKEDFDKYQMGKYKERIANSLYPDSDYWAIDREKNIYLVIASSHGREPETANLKRFIFYVDGDVFTVSIFITFSKLSENHYLQDCKEESWNFIPYFSSSKKSKINIHEISHLFKNAIQTYRFPGEHDLSFKMDFIFNF